MEAQWQADRAALRDLLLTRPDLTLKAMVTRLGRSYSWGKKWAKRLAQTSVNDVSVLHSPSRARKTPFAPWDPLVLARIEQIRIAPPEGLQRTPGPKAILYYLPRDVQLHERGCRLPQSTSTIWKLLTRLGLLAAASPVKHQPEPLREPLEEVQVDFKDASTVQPDPSGEGKRQHVVEICNFVPIVNLFLSLDELSPLRGFLGLFPGDSSRKRTQRTSLFPTFREKQTHHYMKLTIPVA
jgi:hypothetical protein